MAYVKFTIVKLMRFSATLIFLFLVLSAEIILAKQQYSIQIGASTTQQEISYFSNKFGISDSIYEIKSEDWYRYFIGSFDNYSAAREHVKILLQNTKLKDVFVREINDEFLAETGLLKSDTTIQSVTLENFGIKTDTSGNKPDSVQPGYQEEPVLTSTIQKEREAKGIKVIDNSKIADLKNSVLEYGDNYLPLEIRGFYRNVVEKSFRYPIIIVFTVLIIFFIINIASIFLVLSFTIKNKNHKERYIRVYGKMYEEVLLSYMFGEIDWETAKSKLKRKERKPNRKILTSVLLNFHENFKGGLERQIPEIFVSLNLHKDSLKLANSFFNYKKVQGIRELTSLYATAARDLIPELINDPDDNVRSEAQTAFIKLNPDNPFAFFKTLKLPFTRWTQLSAFNLIRVNQLPIPSFAGFLDSKHTNILNFSLRLIIYFQQLENVAEVLKMMDKEMEQTRQLSYRAINDLRLYEGRNEIKKRFWGETYKNKLEIIRALKNIGEVEDFDFLETIILKSDSVSLKTEACRSMYFMNAEGKEKLTKMKGHGNPELELFIAHVTDLRN